jgi:hypothetical protein
MANINGKNRADFANECFRLQLFPWLHFHPSCAKPSLELSAFLDKKVNPNVNPNSF